MKEKTLLVCDLDNTLYDWVGYFVPSFYAMVDEVVRLIGCDREVLLDDFRAVHQRHHDSEHPFALLEVATVRESFRGRTAEDIVRALDPAFHAFNTSRRRTLTLYPGALETLERLRDVGVTLVAHTESKLFAVMDRMTRLGLTEYFSRVYCRERPVTAHPSKDSAELLLEHFPLERVVELSHHQRKPDPDVLNEIREYHGVGPEDTAYVGDSLSRDILMAGMAGVTAIWAKYGTRHEAGLYERLVRITHWTQDDVARETELKRLAEGVAPDFVLETGFPEILDILGAGRDDDRERRAAG